MTVTVRPATPADLDWIIEQLRHLSDFFGTDRPLFEDEALARRGIPVLMRDHLFLVADHEVQGPVGLIAGMLTPHVLNPRIAVLSEILWWVEGSAELVTNPFRAYVGLRLLDAFTDWGNQNADWVIFSLQNRSPVGEHALLRRGFHLQERKFLLEVG